MKNDQITAPSQEATPPIGFQIQPIEMTPSLFRRFQRFAYDHAGIYLKPGKEALVAARVYKRLRVLGLTTAQDYLRFLENDDSGEEIVKFFDVISTNFTSFYREPVHFEILHDWVQRELAAGISRLRLWSVAASTGEEPCSMALTVERARAMRPLDYRILGTDISMRALEKAYDGLYPAHDMKRIPSRERKGFFRRRIEKGVTLWEVQEKLRNRIVYRRMNLAKFPYPLKGPLDVIFCRNVMIYFDDRMRRDLMEELVRLLRPGGVLFTGHAESLNSLRTGLQMLQPSVYVKPNRSSS